MTPKFRTTESPHSPTSPTEIWSLVKNLATNDAISTSVKTKDKAAVARVRVAVNYVNKIRKTRLSVATVDVDNVKLDNVWIIKK